MISNRIAFAATLIGSVAIAATAAAQDTPTFGNPTFGEFTVESGFTPDPLEYPLTAGGGFDSSALTTADGSSCNAGNIATSPDITIQYTAGSYPLRFYVDTPDTDTTLAVNAPDGTWYCVDDFSGLHPAIDFASPQSGQYDIFVGTYHEGDYPQVTLKVTELPGTNGPGQ